MSKLAVIYAVLTLAFTAFCAHHQGAIAFFPVEISKLANDGDAYIVFVVGSVLTSTVLFLSAPESLASVCACGGAIVLAVCNERDFSWVHATAAVIAVMGALHQAGDCTGWTNRNTVSACICAVAHVLLVPHRARGRNWHRMCASFEWLTVAFLLAEQWQRPEH